MKSAYHSSLRVSAISADLPFASKKSMVALNKRRVAESNSAASY